MKPFVAQSGPLRTLEGLYDDRFERVRNVADYPAFTILQNRQNGQRGLTQLRYKQESPLQFFFGIMSSAEKGFRCIFGLRDVRLENARRLAAQLKKQNRLRWIDFTYGPDEDDLVLVELQDPSRDFLVLRGFVPPRAGEAFCYLTRAPFDIFEISWARAARSSFKAGRDDRFRSDTLSLASESRITLHLDSSGGYGLVLHPDVKDLDAKERLLIASGKTAGMDISFAPGLFG